MRLPGIKEEAEEVTRLKGYYIHPYEWSDMLKMASRISAILVSPAATTKTVKDIVRMEQSRQRVKEKDLDHYFCKSVGRSKKMRGENK